MALIQNSRAKKYAHLVTGDEPTEHLESLGDSLIKELVKKQTDTKFSLKKQFLQEKQFQKGVGLVSLTSISAGTSSLESFQQKTKDAEVLQQLTDQGLTPKEAKRIINKQDVLYSNKAECSALNAQQDFVSQSLKEGAEKNQNTDVFRLSRQERELALSVKPNSIETKLVQFALSCQQPARVDLRPASHPINKLAEIEKELFKEHIDPLKLANTVKRKRKQQLEALLPPQNVPLKPVSPKGSSLWDVIDKTANVDKRKPNESKIYTCTNQRLYTIKDGKIIEIGDKTQMNHVSIAKECFSNLSNRCNQQPSLNTQLLEESETKKHHTTDQTKTVENKRSKIVKMSSFIDKEICNPENRKLEEEEQVLRKCTEKEKTSLKGQPFVSVEIIDVNNFQNCPRLTENEIKQMPKFKCYERGEASKTLFIKNLANNVKENDLVGVFGRFQDPTGPKFIYRLMNGKMRGQAFISFPNSEIAANALDSVNGLVLKGKPLIIQFGRESNG